MPFVLAHPAAVLPLRRFCPRYLSFPALVAGSLSPDAGYLLARFHGDEFAHELIGTVGFALPVGLLLLGLFKVLRWPFVTFLPEGHQRILRPVCLLPLGSPLAVVVSVIAGALTHVLLDAVTHKNGWVVEYLPVLGEVVAVVGGHSVHVSTVLWYACSFVGVGWLILAYGKWKQTSSGSADSANAGVYAFVLATLFLAVAVVHHLFQGFLGNCVVAVSSLCLVIGAVLKLGAGLPEEEQRRSHAPQRVVETGAIPQSEKRLTTVDADDGVPPPG